MDERRWLALLRGINVGGRNTLPMADLRALFEAEGCAEVRSYIQSGNVLFTAPTPLAEQVPDLLSQAITRTTGLTVPVVLRSSSQLQAVLAGCPFPEAEPRTVAVAFLADEPTPEAVASLDPYHSPGDRFEVRGREVYLHLPNGVARTKLTNAWLDRRLDTVSTVRSWRTVVKLASLL